ncbi:4a-hydroxytetrahydrobiopterin dehydratase [Phaeobacter sp. J2-8]|uniref:4a-hydroxytetrahydrobiopterin dehydratase n=1 Tax=Phaeobacter sp. J2-8 TaxID=2931394 RepID=UPI001FD508CA|nr:4a-hydroxytetrahydrobiopterin dehydratase [Phaeobacter sp. J2-8]MCJ7873810.1 4a-hydroxytetrahydrobiopterin dehydratase [Phaeobacter sp. J2-8]
MTICTIGGACSPETPLLDRDGAREKMAGLHGDWTLSGDGTTITRKITVKGFAKAVYLANLAAWVADRHGHHPDVAFGWGYCSLSYTTHEAGGLTEVDITCARDFDDLIA